MKIKTSELKGAALDWAVAKCEETLGEKPEACIYCKHHEERSVQDGSEHFCHHPQATGEDHWYFDDHRFGDGIAASCGTHQDCPINDLTAEPYSTSWSEGGPIIERTTMTLEFVPTIGWRAALDFIDAPEIEMVGCSTPLIAAMRCLVASKLGDEVEIPEELA